MLRLLLVLILATSALSDQLNQILGSWTPVWIAIVDFDHKVCMTGDLSVGKTKCKCGQNDISVVDFDTGDGDILEYPALFANSEKEVKDMLKQECYCKADANDEAQLADTVVMKTFGDNYIGVYMEANDFILAKNIPAEADLQKFVESNLNKTGSVLCTSEIKRSAGALRSAVRKSSSSNPLAIFQGKKH